MSACAQQDILVVQVAGNFDIHGVEYTVRSLSMVSHPVAMHTEGTTISRNVLQHFAYIIAFMILNIIPYDS
jgi:hypothetical protein